MAINHSWHCGVLCWEWTNTIPECAATFRGVLVLFFTSGSFVEWSVRDATSGGGYWYQGELKVST